MVRHPTRVALIDSGIGLLPTAGWLRHLRPDLGLDLYLDPEGMPWGSKSSAWIVERVLETGRRAVDRGADAIAALAPHPGALRRAVALAAPHPPSVLEMCEAFATHTGKQLRVVPVPTPLS
ncbi:MAG: Glutamate racemase, partial [uncultured Actinomycetospora sp.]